MESCTKSNRRVNVVDAIHCAEARVRGEAGGTSFCPVLKLCFRQPRPCLALTLFHATIAIPLHGAVCTAAVSAHKTRT